MFVLRSLQFSSLIYNQIIVSIAVAIRDLKMQKRFLRPLARVSSYQKFGSMSARSTVSDQHMSKWSLDIFPTFISFTYRWLLNRQGYVGLDTVNIVKQSSPHCCIPRNTALRIDVIST